MSKLKQLAFYSCVLVLGGTMAHADSVTCSINGAGADCANEPFAPLTVPIVGYSVSGNEISMNALEEVYFYVDPSSPNVYAQQLSFSDPLFVNASAAGDTLRVTGAVSGVGTAYVDVSFTGTSTYVFDLNSSGGSIPSQTFNIDANGFDSIVSSGRAFTTNSLPGFGNPVSGSIGVNLTIDRFRADGSPDDFTYASTTPEPTTWGLIALAGIGLLGYRRFTTTKRQIN